MGEMQEQCMICVGSQITTTATETAAAAAVSQLIGV